MKLQAGLGKAFRADGQKGQMNANPREEDRIGQDRHSEEIEEHGGVAEPRGC
jgi:hypothetical protein